MTAADETKLDPAIVATLYQTHAEEIRQFLVGVLRDRDAAAEVLQITFTKAVEAGHKAREETLKGWLFRVAFHEALALKRRRQTQNQAERKLAWQPATASEKPEESLIRREAVDKVGEGLALLSEEQQQVVRLRIYESKTFAAISEELGIPLGTVLTRMRLALQKLRQQLRGRE